MLGADTRSPATVNGRLNSRSFVMAAAITSSNRASRASDKLERGHAEYGRNEERARSASTARIRSAAQRSTD